MVIVLQDEWKEDENKNEGDNGTTNSFTSRVPDVVSASTVKVACVTRDARKRL